MVFLLVLSLVSIPPAVALSAQQTPFFTKGKPSGAQQKVDSQLAQKIAAMRAAPKGQSSDASPSAIKIDASRRVLVDIRVPVTGASRKKVISLGSKIVSTSVEFHSIVAWVPVIRIYQLAEDRAVRSIAPAPQAISNR